MNAPSFIRLLCGLGLVAGIALSPRLWGLGPRVFPRVPVAGPALPAAVEAAATLLTAGGLLASAWRPGWRWATGAAALLLLWTDQMRWQPWAWEYLLIGVLAGGERLPTRLIVGGVIAWAGFWKLGPLYATGVAPWLGEPLPACLRWTVLTIPYAELLIGAAVMSGWRPARWALLGMHGAALALLVPRGWNTVVWPWQVAAVAIGWVALGGERGSPASADWPAPPDSPRSPVPSRPLAPAAWLALGLTWVLPAAWPLGWVNSYLAWRLYTGDRTDALLEQWAFEDLNVPLSPAPWRIAARVVGKIPRPPVEGE